MTTKTYTTRRKKTSTLLDDINNNRLRATATNAVRRRYVLASLSPANIFKCKQ